MSLSNDQVLDRGVIYISSADTCSSLLNHKKKLLPLAITDMPTLIFILDISYSPAIEGFRSVKFHDNAEL